MLVSSFQVEVPDRRLEDICERVIETFTDAELLLPQASLYPLHVEEINLELVFCMVIIGLGACAFDDWKFSEILRHAWIAKLA